MMNYNEDEIEDFEDELTEEEMYDDARSLLYPNADDEEFEEEMMDRLDD